MIAGQFIYYGRDFVKICKLLGKDEEAKAAEKHISDMEQPVIKHGWDGEWYLRAYDHKSRR